MLGFDQHIECRQTGVGRGVGKHDRFTRPCGDARVQVVDQRPLGRHDPWAARAQYLVCLGDGRGAKSRSRNRLRAADFEDGFDTGEPGGNQGGGVDPAIGTWATTAGTHSIITVLGNEPLPRGTYRATVSMGVIRSPANAPGRSSFIQYWTGFWAV